MTAAPALPSGRQPTSSGTTMRRPLARACVGPAVRAWRSQKHRTPAGRDHAWAVAGPGKHGSYFFLADSDGVAPRSFSIDPPRSSQFPLLHKPRLQTRTLQFFGCPPLIFFQPPDTFPENPCPLVGNRGETGIRAAGQLAGDPNRRQFVSASLIRPGKMLFCAGHAARAHPAMELRTPVREQPSIDKMLKPFVRLRKANP